MAHAAAKTVRILVVDDEPDVHAVTKLSLKGMNVDGRLVTLLTARSGSEAVAQMREHEDVAVILLDVVMESDHAGLEACRAIRAMNRFVRIILRTGQPGSAPERETIERHDVDGYLAKAELTASRLYTAVRTAIRAHDQLVLLERHRRVLATVHDCAVALRAFEPLDTTLSRLLGAAAQIVSPSLAVLRLETFAERGDARRFAMQISEHLDAVTAEHEAAKVASRIAADPEAASGADPRPWADGTLVPLTLHRELGNGWIFLRGGDVGELAMRALTLLAAHAANALYATVARTLLEAQQGPVFDDIAI